MPTSSHISMIRGLSMMYVNSQSDRIRSRNESGRGNYLTPIDHHERNRVGCIDGKCLPFLVRGSGCQVLGDPGIMSPTRFQKQETQKRKSISVLADDARMSIALVADEPQSFSLKRSRTQKIAERRESEKASESSNEIETCNYKPEHSDLSTGTPEAIVTTRPLYEPFFVYL